MRTTITLGLLGLIVAMLAGGCRRHREDGMEACTPGVVYSVGCDDMGVGRCSGDAVIVVCDGVTDTLTCAAGGATLAEDDDSGDGVCPRATVACPPSGAFTVTSRAYGGGSFTCDWRVEPSGGGGPVGPPATPDGGP